MQKAFSQWPPWSLNPRDTLFQIALLSLGFQKVKRRSEKIADDQETFFKIFFFTVSSSNNVIMQKEHAELSPGFYLYGRRFYPKETKINPNQMLSNSLSTTRVLLFYVSTGTVMPDSSNSSWVAESPHTGAGIKFCPWFVWMKKYVWRTFLRLR